VNSRFFLSVLFDLILYNDGFGMYGRFRGWGGAAWVFVFKGAFFSRHLYCILGLN
jgi:hypothetical protein